MDTDADLIHAYISNQDQEAFTRLVERHLPLVLGTCRRICGVDAEDAAQAVFLVLSQRARSLAGHPTIIGWLHVTSTNIARRLLATESARRRREQEHPMQQTATEPPAELRLDEAMLALPRTYREPLILHYYEGHDIEATAAVLSITQQAVAMRLSRGRQMLREWLLKRQGPVIAGLLVGALTSLSASATAADVVPGFAAHTAAEALGFGRGEVTTRAARLAQGHLRLGRMAGVVGCAAVGISMVALLVAVPWPHRGPQAVPHEWSHGSSARLSPPAVEGSLVLVRVPVAAKAISSMSSGDLVWSVQRWATNDDTSARSIEITIYADDGGHHLLTDTAPAATVLETQIALAGAGPTIGDLARELDGTLPIHVRVLDEAVADIAIAKLPGQRTDYAVQLDRILEPIGLVWVVRDGAIVISRRPIVASSPN